MRKKKPTPIPTVTAPSTNVTAPVERGQTIEGAGSANFAWLKYPGRKLGVAFVSPKTDAITAITINWKKSVGYGTGNFGVYTFELQTNAAVNYPSGTVIGRATGIRPPATDGQLYAILGAALTAGMKYHLVITNTDPSPDVNWSSPNGLMTRVHPWGYGTGNRAAVFEGGVWRPWSSSDNPFNTGGGNYVNGEHIPLMLTWADGANTGDPYYSSRLSEGAYFYGNNWAGEHIVWNQPTAAISRIGLSVKRIGDPGWATLVYHLEKVGGSEIATGKMVGVDLIDTVMQNWTYAILPSPVTLAQGSAYRLWFESPGSTDAANCYFTSPVYGDNTSPAWLDCSWGGRQSFFVYGAGDLTRTFQNGDLSFSLQ